MAFTPTKVWAPGDTLLSADIQDNLDDLKVYTHDIEDSAFNGLVAWADSSHLMRGLYEGIPNRYHMISGIWTGYISNSGDGQYTYATAYDTGLLGDNNYQLLPRASLTVEVRKPATLFVQWWAGCSTRDNAPSVPTPSQGAARFWMYKRDLNDPATGVSHPSICRSAEETRPMSTNMIRELTDVDNDSIPKRSVRYPMAAFHLFDSTEVGDYSVGVAYYSTTATTQVFSWGVSLECFYF